MAGQWPVCQVVHWYYGDQAFDDLLAEGIESWSAVAEVTILRTTDQSQAQVVIGFVADLADDPSVPADMAQIQAWRAGLELGLTDEPVGMSVDMTLYMRLNINPAGGWTPSKLAQVARHEFGHALGLDHAPDGVPSCMSATLDESIDTQQPWDIAQAQALYGPPRTQ